MTLSSPYSKTWSVRDQNCAFGQRWGVGQSPWQIISFDIMRFRTNDDANQFVISQAHAGDELCIKALEEIARRKLTCG